MGLEHIAPLIKEDNRRMVLHQTWGHLFPDNDKIFVGSIRIAETDYGDLIVLSDNSKVPSSPWWFSSLMDFTADFLMEHKKTGAVFEIQTCCSVVECDTGQSIEIKNIGQKIVLENN